MRWLRAFVPLSALHLCAACAPPLGGPDYGRIFVQERLAGWEITVSDERWLLLLSNWTNCEGDRLEYCCREAFGVEDCDPETLSDGYVEATVEVDGESHPRVGLRLVGDDDARKRELHLCFDHFEPGQRFHGIRHLYLLADPDDPTMIREALALELMAQAGVPAARTSFVELVTNQGFGGVYTLGERVDRHFLRRQMGESRGNLYRVHRGGNLVYRGPSPADYRTSPPLYELQTNEEQNDWSDLVSLVAALAGQSGTNRETVAGMLDVEQFLQQLAVNTWLSHLDSWAGAGGNFYLYRDRDGLFLVVPRRLGKAFANYMGPACFGLDGQMSVDRMLELDPDAPWCGGPEDKPLVAAVLADDAWRGRYHQILLGLMDGPLRPERVQESVERMRRHIREAALRDVYKGFSNETFEAAFERDVPRGTTPTGADGLDEVEATDPLRVPGLIPFAAARDLALRSFLAGQ